MRAFNGTSMDISLKALGLSGTAGDLAMETIKSIERKDEYKALELAIDIALDDDAPLVKHYYGVFGYEKLSLRKIKSRFGLEITTQELKIMILNLVRDVRFYLEQTDKKYDFRPEA